MFKPHCLVGILLLLLLAGVALVRADDAGAVPANAAEVKAAAERPEQPATVEEAHPLWIGLLMLVLLFSAFFAMTRYNVPLPLAMSLVACFFLVLQAEHAQKILRAGFYHYADIVILFTAVAIPAHMIERSNGFRWMAAYLAYLLQKFRLRFPRLTMPLLLFVLVGLTYVTAGLMHNVTSILIMTPIIIRLCDSFELPSRWILSGALVASNLGGFSTKWGDTPNIVESEVWHLSAGDFMHEVVPANLIVLVVLTILVLRLTQRGMLKQRAVRKSPDAPSITAYGETIQIAMDAADWKKVRRTLYIDRHLLLVGLVSLGAFIVLHVIYDEYKIAIGALTIAAAILLERNEDRFHTLKSLGFDVYLAFAAIFVLAGCVEHSWIGDYLHSLISQAQGAPWAITLTGYFGTTFTEAASWATAVSGGIYATNSSHAAAWALGGGICAGSSSLVTAASAGIILAEESARFKETHEITFSKYLPFGLGFSLFMLIFYATYFSVIYR